MTSVDAGAQSVTCAADRDLTTAGQLQRMLLPPSPFIASGWTAVHRFDPATAVSGDYVDLVPHSDRVYFMLGDVSGKGVAASLLMAELRVMFRTLIPFGLSLGDLMTRASALLCASSLPAQYATLVSGYLEPDGMVAISNAGHPPPLAAVGRGHTDVHATGVPLGMFCKSEFTSARLMLAAGDTLLIYSDGVTEARNQAGQEYGPDRVKEAFIRTAGRPLGELVDGLLEDHAQFRAGRPTDDDLTLLAIRRN